MLGSFAHPPRDRQVEIHHYYYRSKEDYLKKTTLGFVDKEGAKQKFRRADRLEQQFAGHNEIENPWAAEKFSPGITELLQDLGYGKPYV